MKAINNLRLSVTQKCNLTCPYCHEEGQLASDREISLDEIRKISNSAKEAGIKKIKITGGEPLLRKDIVKIVEIIKENSFEDISMVTNGTLLEKYAFALKKAGLNRVNIGCDSLNPGFVKNKNNMINGLRAAKEAGLSPIKINMVVLKGINHDEIDKMVEFAKENDAILQLIELININKDFYSKHYFSLEELEKKLEKKAVKIINKELHNRKQYDLGDVSVEIVRPFKNKFCENCTRLRITADGKIKRCLLRNDNLVDFKNKESFYEALKVSI